MIRLIVVLDRQRGMAKNGGQPWKIPDDETYFASQTKKYGGNVIAGSTTFRTFKGPLVGRQNYVLTRHTEPIPGTTLVHDLDKFLTDFADRDLWVVGGAAVFDEVMKAGQADELYITHIDADLGCDQFFPDYESQFKLIEQSEPRAQNGFHFRYAVYRKKK